MCFPKLTARCPKQRQAFCISGIPPPRAQPNHTSAHQMLRGWMKKSGPGMAPEHTMTLTRPGQGKTDVTAVIESAFVCLVQNSRMRNWGTIFSLVCSPFFKKTQPQALCQPLVAGKWHKLAYRTLAGSNWRKDDPIWITSYKRKLRAEPANTRQPVGKTAPVFSPFTVSLSHWLFKQENCQFLNNCSTFTEFH